MRYAIAFLICISDLLYCKAQDSDCKCKGPIILTFFNIDDEILDKHTGYNFQENYAQSETYNTVYKPYFEKLNVLPLNKILKKLCRRHPFFDLSSATFVVRKPPLDPIWEFEGNSKERIGNFKNGNCRVREKVVRINAKNGRRLKTKRHKYETIYHWE